MVLDILFVILIIVLIVAGWQRGAVASVAKLGITIVSLIGAVFLSRYLSNFFAKIFVTSGMRAKVGDSLRTSIFDKGLSKIDALNVLGVQESMGETVAKGTGNAIDLLVARLAVLFAGALAFIILFIVIHFLLTLLIKGTTEVLNRVPLIGTVNRLLGAVIGVALGFLVVIIIATIISSVSPFVPFLGEQSADSALMPHFVGGKILSSLFAIIL
mgnify:CR=1 FL=1